MNRNLVLLTLCQGLFMTNNVVFIAINGLVGLTLAPLGWTATLPVMAYVVGGALSTDMVARAQRRDRAQGTLNFFVFATLAVSSFSSGVLVTTQGWALLNYGSLVLVAITAVALVWLALRLRTARRAIA